MELHSNGQNPCGTERARRAQPCVEDRKAARRRIIRMAGECGPVVGEFGGFGWPVAFGGCHYFRHLL
jgi:hypothetical protein